MRGNNIYIVVINGIFSIFTYEQSFAYNAIHESFIYFNFP